MDNSDNYLYYILKKTYDSELKERRSLPVIFRILNNPNGLQVTFTESHEGEGPFESIYELRKKSIIFQQIKLQKHRERISKSKNIKTLKEDLLTQVGTTFEKTFVDSFSHIVIGKISRNKLKGVHFYDPDKTQIIEKIKINKETGVWSARIKKQNENTGEWIEKEEISNFFPDNWSISRTFIECKYAYENRVFYSKKTYYSKTKSGIRVKFIIDNENNVITFYPEIE